MRLNTTESSLLARAQIVGQPIYAISGPSPTMIGIELLTQVPEMPGESLFGHVQTAPNALQLLKTLRLRLAGEALKIPKPLRTFINITSLELESDPCLRSGHPFPELRDRQVVVEVLETMGEARLCAARPAWCNLGGCGMEIAIDDAIGSPRDLTALQITHADWLKLSRQFTSMIPRSREAFELALALSRATSGLGVRIVGEGVEDYHELAALQAAGIGYAQGFGLCRPKAVKSLLAGHKAHAAEEFDAWTFSKFVSARQTHRIALDSALHAYASLQNTSSVRQVMDAS